MVNVFQGCLRAGGPRSVPYLEVPRQQNPLQSFSVKIPLDPTHPSVCSSSSFHLGFYLKPNHDTGKVVSCLVLSPLFPASSIPD